MPGIRTILLVNLTGLDVVLVDHLVPLTETKASVRLLLSVASVLKLAACMAVRSCLFLSLCLSRARYAYSFLASKYFSLISELDFGRLVIGDFCEERAVPNDAPHRDICRNSIERRFRPRIVGMLLDESQAPELHGVPLLVG